MDRGNEVEREEAGELFSRVLWLNARALALVLGLLCGIAVFVATNWPVIKGGDAVGPHLSLLSQYFIGYRVSFLGSLIGFAYAFAVGAPSGALIGWAYNKTVEVRS
jgi:ABC-type dipeptide/oligopeptide/nickel transport system permease subunit